MNTPLQEARETYERLLAAEKTPPLEEALEQITRGDVDGARNALQAARTQMDQLVAEVSRLQAEATKYKKWWNVAKLETKGLIDKIAKLKGSKK